jgi:hypothetical protein
MATFVPKPDEILGGSDPSARDEAKRRMAEQALAEQEADQSDDSGDAS